MQSSFFRASRNSRNSPKHQRCSTLRTIKNFQSVYVRTDRRSYARKLQVSSADSSPARTACAAVSACARASAGAAATVDQPSNVPASTTSRSCGQLRRATIRTVIPRSSPIVRTSSKCPGSGGRIGGNGITSPNASRLQADLGARLTFLSASQEALGLGMRLHRGTAPLGDRNGSGYALRLDQPRDAVLMPGDVAYDHIDPAAKAGLTSLAVTHHGGRGAGAPPPGSGTAVISHGVPNRYGHPDPAQILAHSAAGWTLAHTASWGPAPRSDEWLTAP